MNRRGLRFLRQPIQRRLEPPLAEHVLDQAEHHAEAGRGEAEVPVDALREIAGDQRPDECAEVDPHVEDREPGVAPRVARRVQRSDDRADVRLQQAGADDDQGEAGVEEWQRLEGQREVAGGDDDAAEEHAAVLAEEPIGDQAAEDAAPHTLPV